MACSKQKLCYQMRDKSYDNTVHFLQYFDGHDLLNDDLIYEYIAHREGFVGCLSAARNRFRWFLVPCGQCVECRLQAAREMANRIYLEMLTTPTDVWSVTLSYDDEHLPYGEEVIDGNGELRRFPTLAPNHTTQFMKSLRQIFSRDYEKYGMEESFDGIKFYLAGEYGDEHARPHYHFIIFNLPLPKEDVKLCKYEKSQTGEDLFTSQICEDSWSFVDNDGVKRLRGRVRLNVVTWRYACYCARYIMKKQTGKGAEKYKTLGIVPEFTRCSTKEGIGKVYFERHKEQLLKDDCILIKQGDRSVRVSLPKYFLRLAEKEGYDLTELREKRRERAQNTLNECLFNISQDYFEYQRNLEKEKISFQKRLPRVEF